ncbi:MAG: hypothetical protein JNM74_27600 [Myxococcales bacterium]|nr:hypothetical protein [Myxococcales bacterium]
MTIESLLSRLEGSLLGHPSLRAAASEPMPPDVATRHGEWNGRPLCLRSRALECNGTRVRLARVTSDAALQSLTGIVLPRRERLGGILGFDVVAFGAKVTMFICDVTPKGLAAGSSSRSLRDAALALGEERLPEGAIEGTVPPFSTDATFLRPRADEEGRLVEVFEGYLGHFAEMASAKGDEVGAARAEDAYLQGLAALKRQARVLAKLFGSNWVERYFSFFFAPDVRAAGSPDRRSLP